MGTESLQINGVPMFHSASSQGFGKLPSSAHPCGNPAVFRPTWSGEASRRSQVLDRIAFYFFWRVSSTSISS
jgi:hypothetical protein